jgi:hypothetical protein
VGLGYKSPLRHGAGRCVNTQLLVGGAGAVEWVWGVRVVGLRVAPSNGARAGLHVLLPHTYPPLDGWRSLDSLGVSSPPAVCRGCIDAVGGVGERNLFGQVSGQVLSMTSQ